jgi:predicted SAM-dependent methyltransferase
VGVRERKSVIRQADPEVARRAEPMRMHRVERTWSPYDLISPKARGRVKRLWHGIGFSDEFGTLARYEFDMALLRIRCALSPRYRSAVRAVRTRRDLKLHLGCGNNAMPGWLNLDCYPPQPRPGVEILVLDMRRGLPCADGSVAALYSEHFLEHVPFGIVRERLLPECMRVLAPGGVIRIGVPDGEYYVRSYLARGADDAKPMMQINEVSRSSAHQYLYDYATLAHVLAEAGFVDLRRGVANDSALPAFAGIDMVGEGREEATVYIEGRRPSHAG